MIVNVGWRGKRKEGKEGEGRVAKRRVREGRERENAHDDWLCPPINVCTILRMEKNERGRGVERGDG